MTVAVDVIQGVDEVGTDVGCLTGVWCEIIGVVLIAKKCTYSSYFTDKSFYHK